MIDAPQIHVVAALSLLEALRVPPLYFLMVGSLIVGLVIYEKLTWRIGGILVLPILLIFGLFDPMLIPAFAGSAVFSYWAGELAISRTFIYGRRLLYLYIVVSTFATAIMLNLLRVDYPGVVLVVLPGIYAFNIHREGSPGRSNAQFWGLFIPMFLASHAILYPFGFRGGVLPLITNYDEIWSVLVDSQSAANVLAPGLQSMLARSGEALGAGLGIGTLMQTASAAEAPLEAGGDGE